MLVLPRVVGVVKVEALLVKERHVRIAHRKGQFVSKGTFANYTMGYYPESGSTPLVLHVGGRNDVHALANL